MPNAVSMSGRSNKSGGSVEPLYLNWKPYVDVLTNRKTPRPLKKQILKSCPLEIISSLEEIAINLNFYRIPLSTELEQSLADEFTDIAQKLSNITIPLVRKRRILASKSGLDYLENFLPLVLLEINQKIHEDVE